MKACFSSTEESLSVSYGKKKMLPSEGTAHSGVSSLLLGVLLPPHTFPGHSTPEFSEEMDEQFLLTAGTWSQHTRPVQQGLLRAAQLPPYLFNSDKEQDILETEGHPN